jgi:hypothetical protein
VTKRAFSSFLTRPPCAGQHIALSVCAFSPLSHRKNSRKKPFKTFQETLVIAKAYVYQQKKKKKGRLKCMFRLGTRKWVPIHRGPCILLSGQSQDLVRLSDLDMTFWQERREGGGGLPVQFSHCRALAEEAARLLALLHRPPSSHIPCIHGKRGPHSGFLAISNSRQTCRQAEPFPPGPWNEPNKLQCATGTRSSI